MARADVRAANAAADLNNSKLGYEPNCRQIIRGPHQVQGVLHKLSLLLGVHGGKAGGGGGRGTATRIRNVRRDFPALGREGHGLARAARMRSKTAAQKQCNSAAYRQKRCLFSGPSPLRQCSRGVCMGGTAIHAHVSRA